MVKALMGFYIIIRGPAGSGKSAVASGLAKELNARCIHFDDILAKHKLDKIEGSGISTENFIKGDELVVDGIRELLERGQIVIIDACFYRRGHIAHLINSLPFRHYVFSLEASTEECIRRNKLRGNGLTWSTERIPTGGTEEAPEGQYGIFRSRTLEEKDIRDVHALVSRLKVGVPIETGGKGVDDVIRDIKSRLSF